jgi:hypothetical protein
MKHKKKISKSNAKATTGNDKQDKRRRSRDPMKAGPAIPTSPPYRYRRATYQSKAALIIAYLNAHEVFTGQVPPPSVADFVRDTGVQAGHRMYGARLDEYVHTPRTDKDGTFTIDRRALRAGKDGRVFQIANTTEGAPSQSPAKDCR